MSLLAEIDWNRMFRPEIMVFVCVFGMITIIAVAGIVCGIWHSVEKTRAEARLKREMVAKGYHADEIERVVRATTREEREGESPITNDQ